MDRQLTTLIEALGFDKEASAVYVAILTEGEASIATISEATKIPRSSVYFIVKSLRDKGMIQTLPIKKRLKYVAEDPERLYKLQLEKLEAFKEALPLFQRARKVPRTPNWIRSYKDMEGVRQIFKEILEEKRDFDAITSIDDMEAVAQDCFAEFITQRINQHLRIRLLTNKSAQGVHMKNEDAFMLRETRFLPGRFPLHTANYIFGNNVAILSLRQKPVTGIIISDANVARTNQVYFDNVWQSSQG